MCFISMAAIELYWFVFQIYSGREGAGKFTWKSCQHLAPRALAAVFHIGASARYMLPQAKKTAQFLWLLRLERAALRVSLWGAAVVSPIWPHQQGVLKALSQEHHSVSYLKEHYPPRFRCRGFVVVLHLRGALCIPRKLWPPMKWAAFWS